MSGLKNIQGLPSLAYWDQLGANTRKTKETLCILIEKITNYAGPVSLSFEEIKSLLESIDSNIETTNSLINSFLPLLEGEYETCSGTAPATNALQVALKPGQVVYTKRCPTDNSILDPEVVCVSLNDSEPLSAVQVITVDMTTGVPSSKIWLNNVDVTDTHVIVPCQKSISYDYEQTQICVDGQQLTKVFVFDSTTDGTPNLISTLWLNEEGTLIPSPDPDLINNINCSPSIFISDAFADNLGSLLPSNSYSITKKECQVILITTSIGSFRIIKGIRAYSTENYDREFEIISVSILEGGGSLADIHIIGNKTK